MHPHPSQFQQIYENREFVDSMMEGIFLIFEVIWIFDFTLG